MCYWRDVGVVLFKYFKLFVVDFCSYMVIGVVINILSIGFFFVRVSLEDVFSFEGFVREVVFMRIVFVEFGDDWSSVG